MKKVWIVGANDAVAEINSVGELTLAVRRQFGTWFARRVDAQNFAALCRRQGLNSYGSEFEVKLIEPREDEIR